VPSWQKVARITTDILLVRCGFLLPKPAGYPISLTEKRPAWMRFWARQEINVVIIS
jgi:hypothetical protein